MKRMKTFFTYALLIVGFYFLANFFIYGHMVAVYKPIDELNVDTSFPAVHIVEAKSTFVNGRVLGRITNNLGKDINKTYMQMDFYSSQDVRMGRKYITIEDFKKDEIKEFQISFKYKDIQRVDISFTNAEPEKVEEFEITDAHRLAMLAGAAIVWYYTPLKFFGF